jgi:hypothetical protein
MFFLGFQLSMQGLLYDVQFSTRTVKIRRNPDDTISGVGAIHEVFFAS